MMTCKYSGSCLCGAVKFEIHGVFDSFYLCHCSRCQKDTGSAHGANLFSTTAQLTWLQGQAFVKTFQLPSTRHCKSFCVECGSALPNVQMGGTLLVVPAGSLDSPLVNRPDAHLFMSSKAEWDERLDSVKQYEALPF
ncbi:GFA family protein [Photobacterium sp. TY1-4]|uniref:GFA family protein n=1 Tax=Photobacterium sp. TY1-4 TaxID=2899122 RepID=UPI0021C15699|nr:GFA family protein [Photobacterium sp. TY1-4]UXH99964.1 GFA family protein [Photobacterium sp. TY1-4]